MTVEFWPIDKPVPYARNARKISDAAVEKVARSVGEFGWRQPLVVDAEGIIIAGHARLLAARKLGLDWVPVHVARELTPEQVRLYRLMDNRSHQETDWDYEALGTELFDLQKLNLDLNMTGFDEDELAELLAVENPGLTDPDSCPEPPAQPVSVPGDMWVLGEHRVLCGDCTNDVEVKRLMNGVAADMVFTDPPYNVAYEGYTKDRLKIEGDRMSDAEFRAFLEGAFSVLRTIIKPEASVYVSHASSVQRDFQTALETAGFEVRSQIIWAKNTFAWGHARYKFQHEPIFYCHVAGQSDPWYGDKSQSTLWQEKKPAANRLHPTMKPVELIERALVNSSKRGDIVADLFGGSGSTLIACEKLGRAARLMEIDPKYVDVIVQRYRDFTGKQATLHGDGRCFDDIAVARTGALRPRDRGTGDAAAGGRSGSDGPATGAFGLVDGASPDLVGVEGGV
jgi:DNA modification methylase